jgi:hypothetical protein
MELWLVYGPPPNSSDVIVAATPAETIFTSDHGVRGIKVDEDGHKLVFQSFPFESVSFFEADAPNNRDTLLGRVLSWFGADTGADPGEIHRLAIDGVFPNPFNPATKIAYTVPENAGRVTLTMHNVSGQVVRTLVDEELPAGPRTVFWDGTSDDGKALATGVYFAKLATGEQEAFAKMTLLK